MITPLKVSLTPSGASQNPVFSVCTLLTNKKQYYWMLETFEMFGFSDKNSEFLFVDNSNGNACSAAVSLNNMISKSTGMYVILCHQDVELFDDGYLALVRCLNELDKLDSNWALAGNAGGLQCGKLALRISDPHGDNQKLGNFPEKVVSLDENFIVLKKSTLIGFSVDLSGYHLYGADICLNAHARGLSAYVIDFHLRHLSGGSVDEAFFHQVDSFEEKYRRLYKTRWLKTTCAEIPLTNSRTKSIIMKIIRSFVKLEFKLKAMQRKARASIDQIMDRT